MDKKKRYEREELLTREICTYLNQTVGQQRNQEYYFSLDQYIVHLEGRIIVIRERFERFFEQFIPFFMFPNL